MGKQPKNRRHRHRRDKDNHQGEKKKNESEGSEHTPTLLKRLRHGDEATRLAALVALQNRPGPMLAHPRLLEAVRDQLMGGSLVVATQACHCMLAHLSSGAFHEEATAGWMGLLVQRLQTCADLLLLPNSQSSNIHSARAPTATATVVLELSTSCLECLAVLTEVNPLAMRRILRSRLDILSVLAPWLEGRPSSSSALPSCTIAAEWAARCLHSAVDDNAELVVPWLAADWEHDPQPRSALQALESAILSSPGSEESETASADATTAVTSTTRLHAAGAWLAIWRLLSRRVGSGRNARGSALVECLASRLEACLRLLVSHVKGLDQRLAPLLPRLRECHAQWSLLQRDAALEREVVACQVAKHESARSIARRLKQQPDEKGTEAMVVEPEEESATGGASQPLEAPPKQCNVQLEWEDVHKELHAAVRPFQLSLEILINLTTLEGLDEEDDDSSVLPDAEPSLDARFSRALVHLQVPRHVQFLLAEGVRLVHLQPSSEPLAVVDALGDVTNKAGTLLGHLLANLPSDQWQAPPSLWDDLIDLLRHESVASAPLSSPAPMDATRSDEDGAVTPLSAATRELDEGGTAEEGRRASDVGTEGVTTALAMGLQSRRIHPGGGESTVALVLRCLSSTTTSSSPVAVRNLLCLLGLLLSSSSVPHSEQMLREGCAALLRAAEPSRNPPLTPLVVAEACNVVMDLFGRDDDGVDNASESRRRVYDELDVANFMRRCARVLKRDDEETAFNAERFIDYMAH